MLPVTIAGQHFPSPILNASGCFNPENFNRMFPLKGTLGGIVTKTVTAQHQVGNAQYRTVELPGIGMLNSIGIQNAGLDHFLDHDIEQFREYKIPIILSISANSSQKFAQMAEKVVTHPNGKWVDALELNLSCPNIDEGGVHFGVSPISVKQAVQAVCQIFSKPVFAKLTPNVTNITEIGGAAIEGGAHALVAINTVLGLDIDVKLKKPVLERVSGGYSGPGIRPIALQAVWQLHKHFPETPIIAVGGICNTEDALAFFMAGASMIQIGTICFRNPLIFQEIHQQLLQYLDAQDLADISELVGCAHQNVDNPQKIFC
ncbi:MAG: dihydroorotate dehydrogenase [Vampirovibrio sp.]|nr:dihydroorotate dehydrogenase [Vampirovibrio sp.]